ncbi:ATP-binding protein [Streptomyces sp. TRM75561]|uniref:ATP-binding protein n=1 Tax=unclassified Streptomyces TaxID=2593676 RepID=UPI002447E95D|nr:ATP-binding protein [Streptomyces sp. TRM75561]MDH3033118.1 ATP-binding protein [Streptomyces sp. TRM75561]
MTNNPAGPTGPGRLATPAAHLGTASPGPTPACRTFAMRFTSTPRGARLARHLTAVRLDAWGLPYGTDDHDAIVLIVAELTANAVLHGNVPGRDFHLRLALLATGPRSATVRVEVTDSRGERVPPRPGVSRPEVPAVDETGRGLLLVAALAARWDWRPRPGGPGKTVWAEYETATQSDVHPLHSRHE